MCGFLATKTPTIRQDAALANMVLYGKLANARVTADGGVTELYIDKVLKSHPFLGDQKVIKIPRYVTIDPKDPYFVLFVDVLKGKLDPYRGIVAKSPAVVEYVQKVLALDGRDRTKTLLFYFDYLDHKDAEISNDAFREFAQATDPEIGQVGGQLAADKVRRWLQDPQTPADRLGLYGFLLGSCGGDQDASLLRSMLDKPTERTNGAIGGLLSGYIRLRPREGWKLADALLGDTRRPFIERYGVVGAVRLYHGWQPTETRAEVLRCLDVLVNQGDLADLAIEDLRRWQLWDLTDDVLGQYRNTTHSAPIVRRAIVRYALSCPKAEASRFVAEVRKQDPELVNDVEEGLRFERK
jgi:hypothetical protein